MIRSSSVDGGLHINGTSHVFETTLQTGIALFGQWSSKIRVFGEYPTNDNSRIFHFITQLFKIGFGCFPLGFFTGRSSNLLEEFHSTGLSFIHL